MLKVMTIVGTRPELIKMSRVIATFDAHTRHVLVHTGQNYDYELNQGFFDDLGIRKPDHFLNAAGKNAMHTIGASIGDHAINHHTFYHIESESVARINGDIWGIRPEDLEIVIRKQKQAQPAKTP